MTITTVEYRAAARTHASAWPTRLSLLTLCAAALALRFWAFGRIPSDPFYDASVRSMGLSWRNFFLAAFDPGATLAIDKPPIDLWLQVLSTKLFGFSSVSVRLPEAIAGVLAVPLLYDVVRRASGRVAGLSAAAALTVLPAAVITSRSDAMDSLTGTVLLGGAWAIVAARPAHRDRGVLAAAALGGLAFEIKLFQAAVAFPALCAIAWLSLAPGDRTRTLRRAALVFLGVASVWPVAASLVPGPHPWPLGSTDGRLWNVILLYNGLYRIGSYNGTSGLAGPSPWRLFTPDYMDLVGFQLLATVLAGAAAFIALRRGWLHPDPLRPPAQRVLTIGIVVWVACGYLLFSAQGWIRVRYFEAFTPALAAGLGLSVSWLWFAVSRRLRWRRGVATALIAVSVGALLAWPLRTSVEIARTGRYASQTLGALPAPWVERLHAYLAVHGGQKPLVVSSAVLAGPLIVRDPRPVVVLTSWKGRPFVSTAALRAKADRGAVRYALLDPGLNAPAVRWALERGNDVSAAAGLGTGAGPGLRLVRLVP